MLRDEVSLPAMVTTVLTIQGVFSFSLSYKKKIPFKRCIGIIWKYFHELTFLIKQIIFINVEYIYIKKD